MNYSIRKQLNNISAELITAADFLKKDNVSVQEMDSIAYHILQKYVYELKKISDEIKIDRINSL